MSLGDSIKKLMEGDNLEDKEIAATLLESDELSMEAKKKFIEDFLEEYPDQFTEGERRLLKKWLSTNNNQTIQKLELWILKNR